MPQPTPSPRRWIGGARTCRRRVESAAKIRAQLPVLAVFPLAILVIVLAALAVFALCLRARPLTPASLLRNRPRSRLFGHELGPGESTAASPTLGGSSHSVNVFHPPISRV